MAAAVFLTVEAGLALCLTVSAVLFLLPAAVHAARRLAAVCNFARSGTRIAARVPSFIGVAFALTSSSPPAPPLVFPRQGAGPPWSWTGGFPSPPRPLVPARAPSPERRDPRPRRVSVMGAGAYTADRDRGHPAFHGRRRAPKAAGERLFPSRTGRVSERARGAAGTPIATYRVRGDDPEVAREPGDGGSGAGRPDARSCRRETHTVRPGETLWSIAGAVLGTTDAHRIARYWPRIHRNNRALIGSTPDLIRPGWVLRLPPECD